MSRKQPTEKKTDKKNFFGDHLEIKPTFMQRPKSMEEVMAEAFSRPSTVENKTIVEDKTTVEQNSIVENSTPTLSKIEPTAKKNYSTVENSTTVKHNSIVENSTPSFSKIEQVAKKNYSTVEDETRVNYSTTVDNKTRVDYSPTVENSTTVEQYATIEQPTTIVLTTVDNKSIDKQEKSLTQPAKETNLLTLSEAKTNTILLATVEHATVVNDATIAKKATVAEIPSRLRADVSLLKRVVDVKWQEFPQIETIAKDSPTYWQAYTKAWHWIEDEIVPYLDKDSKLTLRKCYRKAFGDISAKGKFFAGQTLLSQEVGLSKRRIQDILEIFNLLGWVRKIAHHNRGGYKGTDYEMYLPPKAIDYFLEV